MLWTHQPEDRYVVTGILVTGRRFKPLMYANPHVALAINLYRGTVWVVRKGHRHLLQRVWN